MSNNNKTSLHPGSPDIAPHLPSWESMVSLHYDWLIPMGFPEFYFVRYFEAQLKNQKEKKKELQPIVALCHIVVVVVSVAKVLDV